MRAPSDRFIVYPSNGGFRWRLRGLNGRIIAASSEAFASRTSARRNARRTVQGLVRAMARGEMRAKR